MADCDVLYAAWALVTYDFKATDEEQISVKRGEKLAVISKRAMAKGWWKAVLPGSSPSQSRVGYVPVNYMVEIALVDQLRAAAEALEKWFGCPSSIDSHSITRICSSWCSILLSALIKSTLNDYLLCFLRFCVALSLFHWNPTQKASRLQSINKSH